MCIKYQVQVLYLPPTLLHCGQQQYMGIFYNSKVHGANMGPIWDRQDPGETHVGPVNFAIWVGARDR